jgi:hypothetical protein
MKSDTRYFVDCFSGYFQSLVLPRFWGRTHGQLLLCALVLAIVLQKTMTKALHWSMSIDVSTAGGTWLLNITTTVLVLLVGALVTSGLSASAALYHRRHPKNSASC